MARRGWSTSNFLRCGAAIVSGPPLTIAAWVKTSKTANEQYVAGIFASGSTVNLQQMSLVLSSAAAVLARQGDTAANAATTSTTFSADTWFHACAVFASATDRRAFLNGGGKGTNATSRTCTGLDRTSLGLRDNATANEPLAPSGTGDLGEVAMWNIALSDADVASLANGIHPFLIHPEALVAYWPLIGVNSPENNLKSNTQTMAIQGTLDQSLHPRVFYYRESVSRVALAIVTAMSAFAVTANASEAGKMTKVGTVSVAASAGLSEGARSTLRIAQTLAVSAGLSVAGRMTRLATVTLAATGALSSLAASGLRATVSFAASAAETAAGIVPVTGALQFAASVGMSAVSTVARVAQSAFAAVAGMSETGQASLTASSSLEASPGLSEAGSMAKTGTMALGGVAGASFGGRGSLSAGTGFSASTGLSVAGRVSTAIGISLQAVAGYAAGAASAMTARADLAVTATERGTAGYLEAAILLPVAAVLSFIATVTRAASFIFYPSLEGELSPPTLEGTMDNPTLDGRIGDE